jgi:hypothetical protein
MMGPTWNDARDYSLLPGYVMEIPEPATLGLLGVGGLALLRRKRRAR